MGQVIDFGDRAVATLRARVAAAEEANQDLIAFARGHSGTVAAIHAAVLATFEAEDLAHLVHLVVHDWPDMLGVDAVALAMAVDRAAFRADADGLQPVDRRFVERAVRGLEGVVLHGVERGHPLFGPAASLIRAEALIRIVDAAGRPTGLLALGQRAATRLDPRHGSELLMFLGAVLGRAADRWLRA